MSWSGFGICSVIFRGCSVNANTMVSTINTGSGNIKSRHNHSPSENVGGQLSSQKGAEAQTQTPSQTKERKANNRVLGLPTDWRLTQPPP